MEAEIMLRLKVQHGEKCKLCVSVSVEKPVLLVVVDLFILGSPLSSIPAVSECSTRPSF